MGVVSVDVGEASDGEGVERVSFFGVNEVPGGSALLELGLCKTLGV